MNLSIKYLRLPIYCLLVASTIAALTGVGSRAVAKNEVSSPLRGGYRAESISIGNKFDISQERPNGLFKSLPRSVTDAVRQDIARRTGINSSRVRILSYSRQTWSDACLGLPKSDEYCAQVLTPGWRVRASADRQTWVYHTDTSGRNIRLDREDASNAELPRAVRDAVLRDIEDRFNIDRDRPEGSAQSDRLRIIAAERRTWSNGCLELGEPDRVCTQEAVFGWRVTVAGNNRQWVYRTDGSGYRVAYDRQASSDIPDADVELPKRVVDAVLKDASSVFGVPSYRLKITQAEERNWAGGCLELPKPGEGCTRNIVPGWRITVVNDSQRLIYHSDRSGYRIRLNQDASDYREDSYSEFPESLADKILRETQRRSGLSRSSLKIASAERKTWSDSCLGLGGAAEICARERIEGWQVAVEGGKQRWIYRSDRSGSRIILDVDGSDRDYEDSIGSRQIPSDLLPPSLGSNVVFRAISSGGIAGRTFETVLLEDGRVQRLSSRSGIATQINRISESKVREFQQLLDRERFYRFDRLDYPANRGAADFITVTLTSSSGTTRYADIVRDRLPESLQKVIDAWNDIGN